MQTAVAYVAGAFTSDISNEGYHRSRQAKSGVITLFSYKLSFDSLPTLICCVSKILILH